MEQPTSIAPLITFRILFGCVTLISTIRYLILGWVGTQLLDPAFHFHYYGFSWVAPLPGQGMYLVFVLMVLASLGVLLGYFYRISSLLFFLCFTYVELIDLTYYLNHYYFVSIISFLLILVPANANFSVDVMRNPALKKDYVSRWCIDLFKLQIAIVYCFAGLAKINYDWLFRALPLAIWLPAKTSIPLVGPLFSYKFTAYLFSWTGMLFDTFIVGALIWKRTRLLAYITLVIFHITTGMLFQIGIFPVVMISATVLFFSNEFHLKLLKFFNGLFRRSTLSLHTTALNAQLPTQMSRLLMGFLTIFLLFQLLFPWRYLLYNGNVFWTEQGYRFSWRVMLMEKSGTATFYVQDGPEGREGAVITGQFLNGHQEKQMAMQPDMIIQFAHYLADHYQTLGMEDPRIRAEVWVTLNGSPAQLLIDPQRDLTTLEDSWSEKTWILPWSRSLSD